MSSLVGKGNCDICVCHCTVCRNSMEHLWQSLKEANPELLTDFEDFVAEVASEVEGAQRALE